MTAEAGTSTAPTPDGFRVRSRPPTGRCHECGSPEIQTWCCRCHLPMCQEHDRSCPSGGLLGQLRELPPVRRLCVARRAPKAGAATARHYCKCCMHQVDAHAGQFVAAAGLLVAGLVLALWTLPLAVVLTLLGAGWLALRIARYLPERKAIRRATSLALHLEPVVRSISLVDHITATATLDEELNYTVEQPSVGGTLAVEAEWSDAARSAVSTHREHHEISDDLDVRFASGALVLRGPVGLELPETNDCRLVSHCVVLLGGWTRRHAALRPETGGHRSWTISADYRIRPEPGPTPDEDREMPIWLTPALVPGSARRSLDLELQWTKFGPGEQGLPMSAIDRLRIAVPIVWGTVLEVSEDATIRLGGAAGSDEDGAGERVIEWSRIDGIEHTPRGRHRISLTFKNEITETDALHGRIDATFAGNLCQIEKVDLYGPGGARRPERPKKKMCTKVHLNFRLSLAAVRYQSALTLPEPSGSEPSYSEPSESEPSGSEPSGSEPSVVDAHSPGAERAEPEPRPLKTFPLVIPNSTTIARLTQELSDSDRHIERVMENPPQPARKQSVLRRYWDIAGRRYRHGVWPIDFHLSLTDEEVHDGGRAVSGTTEVALSVRGTHTSSPMAREVREEWESLTRLIERVMESCHVSDPCRTGSSATVDYIKSLVDNDEITPRVAAELRARLADEFGVSD